MGEHQPMYFFFGCSLGFAVDSLILGLFYVGYLLWSGRLKRAFLVLSSALALGGIGAVFFFMLSMTWFVELFSNESHIDQGEGIWLAGEHFLQFVEGTGVGLLLGVFVVVFECVRRRARPKPEISP